MPVAQANASDAASGDHQLSKKKDPNYKNYQFNPLNGKNLVPFEALLQRTDNPIIYKHMVPHDRRFEPIKANYDLLSKYHTLHVPGLR